MPLTQLRHATQKPPVGIVKLDLGNPLTLDLARCWLFNEMGSGGPINDLTGANSATFLSTPTWQSTTCGPALQMNSADLQNRGLSFAYTAPANGNFTIETWVKLDAANGEQRLFTTAPIASQTNGLHYNSSGNLFSWVTSSGDHFNTTVQTLGTWIHYVVTIGNGGVDESFYVNGVLDRFLAGTATSASMAFIKMGTQSGGSGDMLGNFALVRAWNRTLSANEVAALYSEPYAMFQTRPIQRWITLYGDQHARPSANVTTGTWLDQSGANTNLFGPINEVTIDDTTYIQSAANPQSDLVEVSLGAVIDPLTKTGHVLRYRTRLDALGPTGSGAMSLVTELRQGTAALSTAVTDTIAPASITGTTNTVALSTAQAGAITDYSLLRLRSTATQSQAAAPTFVAAGTFIATASNAASITPGLPAGTNGQDVLLLCIERGDNTAATALSGWTNIAALTSNDTTAQRVEVWWRVAAGTAGSATSTTAIAITFGSSTIVRAGQMFAFRGADVTTPFVLSSFKTNVSGNTCATTDISPTITNTLGFFAAMAVGQRTAATTPSGWAAPVVSNTALGNDASIAYTTKTFAVSGSYSTPTTTWTSTTSGVTEGVLFAIQPPVNASKARITWAELEVPGRLALGELSGRPYGLHGQQQMHQLLAQ